VPLTEVASPYSITSSARASSVGGMGMGRDRRLGRPKIYDKLSLCDLLNRLSLSEIKSEHIGGVISQELALAERARRSEQLVIPGILVQR
jgi:hypothetical protein